ncbi:hypothetical protein OE88DRAFT_1629177 [Heliocybe sulcata]|uniref:Uncharacterized protein n=1 Tax=Heliocybe sulcata TaxID=5364 RepID=A0A5C3N713_9AGAM|nr:hypothetical protein OE88DRAFT_1629177 [Heliocybe sulcata]
MCIKIVQYAEYTCGHQIVTREQVVDCHQQNCRLSRSHRSDVHDCTATCQQQ